MPGRDLGTTIGAGDRGGLEVCAGKMRSKGVCWQSAEREAGNIRRKALCWQSAEQSLGSCLGRTRPAVLSLEERRSEVKRLLHEVQGCRPRAFVRGDQQEAPAVLLSWWSLLEGEEDPLRWDAIRGKQGLDSMGSYATP